MQWCLGYSIVIETIVKTTTNNMGDMVCISGVDISGEHQTQDNGPVTPAIYPNIATAWTIV